ncbi:uncharacterized protein N7477_006719 [Penicillium maclennaniae]|uniref:uncharacterized protein n=1 Tax=Penicillium maclennaniae TaxID=1343394 RepID=UPI0025411E6D|nr:uncharacterized protein N7477_006719 [Penicillium maclennaniae]KAJ5668149.1 hypothetical protein N7477_006719 [Penicillium maclennaniae]
MPARTSTRQAAQKAKEAITSSIDPSDRVTPGSKRKASSEKNSKTKKEKIEKTNREAPTEDGSQPKTETIDEGQREAKPVDVTPSQVDEAPETKATLIPGTPTTVDKQPEVKHAVVQEAAIHSDQETGIKEESKPETVPGTHNPAAETTKPEADTELGVHKSEEREHAVSSNILEKGIIYFFFRPRVNVEDPHGFEDVARSFFVLRPTPLGGELDHDPRPLDKNARCRLLMLPKKKFPTKPGEREMGFVEKADQTIKDLQENFFAAKTYETATRGERTVGESRPYAEGVYAITSTKRASHLAYVLTIPAELGDIQDSFGIHHQGSWIVSSKNPKYPGPSFAQLPKQPEYPASVLEKFRDLRWIPLEPELIEYSNAQFLMIGEAQGSLGKATTAEGNKEAHEHEPGQELKSMEQENEHRVEALQGDQTIFQDLGLHGKKYATLQTTWTH